MQKKQVCFVTGAASGIGRHLAGAFVARGWSVFATDIERDALAAFAREQAWPAERVATAALDVRNSLAWEETLDAAEDRFGPIDVLLNAAGVIRPGLVHHLDAAAVDLHLDINAKGTIYGTQAAARRMVSRGAGHIVNLASMAALAPVPGLALYTASKFAVRGFSLAMAREVAPLGVAITVICPDAVRTPMLDLQVDYPEAALTFSAPRFLEVGDLEQMLFGRVLPRRPLEVTLPRSRGWLAKLSSLAPGWTAPLVPWLTRRGLAAQRRLRADK
ncbi:MAG: SDR family oxidoreductase [Pirellulales bacterium]|nr:SDR family oxidoreductase [Pirellulales bacterium]